MKNVYNSSRRYNGINWFSENFESAILKSERNEGMLMIIARLSFTNVASYVYVTYSYT